MLDSNFPSKNKKINLTLRTIVTFKCPIYDYFFIVLNLSNSHISQEKIVVTMLILYSGDKWKKQIIKINHAL